MLLGRISRAKIMSALQTFLLVKNWQILQSNLCSPSRYLGTENKDQNYTSAILWKSLFMGCCFSKNKILYNMKLKASNFLKFIYRWKFEDWIYVLHLQVQKFKYYGFTLSAVK